MTSSKHHQLPRAGSRLLLALIIGLVIGTIVSWWSGPVLAVLVAWDAMGLSYAGWVWLHVGRMDPQQTAELAIREDPGRAATDTLLLVASIASLAAIGFLLVEANSLEDPQRAAVIALGVASVLASWLLVHTIFALHYARLYFGKPTGGLDFNQAGQPDYADFAYFSFTIGMTFQVSDTAVTTRDIRRTVLRHAFISYLYGTVIVAATINLIAGLWK